MDDVLFWISIVTSIVVGLTVGFAAWMNYVILEAQHVIDGLESQIMTVLDDALQFLIPTPILHHISHVDVGNFEMNLEPAGKDKSKAWLSFLNRLQKVHYAEDVSLPLSEREQMYCVFGDSEKVYKKNLPVDAATEVERRTSMHRIDIQLLRGSKSPLERKSNKRQQEMIKVRTTSNEPKPSKKLMESEEQKTQMSSKIVDEKMKKGSQTEKIENGSKDSLQSPEKSSRSIDVTQQTLDEAASKIDL